MVDRVQRFRQKTVLCLDRTVLLSDREQRFLVRQRTVLWLGRKERFGNNYSLVQKRTLLWLAGKPCCGMAERLLLSREYCFG